MLYCFQDKGSGALLFSGEGNWCTFVLKEKEPGALLLMFSGEGDWCSTVFRRRELMHSALLFSGYEKETGALLFLGEITGTILFPREGNWCFIVFRRINLVLQVVHRRRDLVLYRSQRE